MSFFLSATSFCFFLMCSSFMHSSEIPSIIRDQVREHLRNMNIHKSMGSNEVHRRVLRELADLVAEPLCITFESHGSQEKSPVTGKRETPHTLLKRVKRTTLGNISQSASSLCPVRSRNRSSWKLCQGIWKTGRLLQSANIASRRANRA